MTVVDFAVGVAVGVTASAAIAWVLIRLLMGHTRPQPPGVTDAIPREVGQEVVSGASLSPGPMPTSPGARVEPAARLDVALTHPEQSGAPSPVRISRRVLLHLWEQGALRGDEVATVAFTQRGMADALGATQGTLTGVLARLVAGGALQVDRRHVRGQRRRLKVYRLTPQGESIVRDLRLGQVGRGEGTVAGVGRTRAPVGPREPMASRSGNEG